MAVIDRNILRLAVFELFFLDDIPPKVSINEGIELAKRYGDLDSARFVNGILDKIYKTENSIKNKS
jgi:N utilization substance protein B